MLKRPLPTRDCGAGWNKLIDTLIADLDVITGRRKVEVVQIKEKFGALRFYLAGKTKLPSELLGRIQARIGEAERSSAVICEECGEPGMIHTWDGRGYYCARCQRHAREIARTNLTNYRGQDWNLDRNWRLVDKSGVALSEKIISGLDMAAAQSIAQIAEDSKRLADGMANAIRQRAGIVPNVRVHMPADAAHHWQAARFLAE